MTDESLPIAPHDARTKAELRASDGERERVVEVLSAAGGGRLTAVNSMSTWKRR